MPKSIEFRLYSNRRFGEAEYNGSKCWLWTGTITKEGYGRISYQSRDWYVHRLMYSILVEPVPEGLVIDHLCRVPACFNPEHLEPVTQAENFARGEQPNMLLSKEQ